MRPLPGPKNGCRGSLKVKSYDIFFAEEVLINGPNKVKIRKGEDGAKIRIFFPQQF